MKVLLAEERKPGYYPFAKMGFQCHRCELDIPYTHDMSELKVIDLDVDVVWHNNRDFWIKEKRAECLGSGVFRLTLEVKGATWPEAELKVRVWSQ